MGPMRFACLRPRMKLLNAPLKGTQQHIRSLPLRLAVTAQRMAVQAFLTLLIAGLASAQEWELIWEDNFDTFDSSKWDHEVTMWGGGVSSIIHDNSTKDKRIWNQL